MIAIIYLSIISISLASLSYYTIKRNNNKKDNDKKAIIDDIKLKIGDIYEHVEHPGRKVIISNIGKDTGGVMYVKYKYIDDIEGIYEREMMEKCIFFNNRWKKIDWLIK